MISKCRHFINEDSSILTFTTFLTVYLFTTILDGNHDNAFTLSISNEREKLIEELNKNIDSWKFEDCCLDLIFTTFKSEIESLKNSKYIVRRKFISWLLAYSTTPGTAIKREYLNLNYYNPINYTITHL